MQVLDVLDLRSAVAEFASQENVILAFAFDEDGALDLAAAVLLGRREAYDASN